MNRLKGAAYLFGNNIDTDQVYPGRYLELTEHDEIAAHVMEGADPSFAKRFVKGGFIVAGANFGCGSSREHAVITLKTAGIAGIIAVSFARIFYRNCINLGLPAIVTPDLASFGVREGSELEVDLGEGRLVVDGREGEFIPLPPDILELVEQGGVFSLYRRSKPAR